MNSSVPVYYLKVLKLDGTTLASADGSMVANPLPVADLTFTETLYRPGQKNLGDMTATLLDVRDTRYANYRDLYFQLNYEQRLEVYDSPDCIGTPVWTGVLTRLPNSLDKAQISGQGILRRLDTRRLYRYQSLSGNASTMAQNLLKTYDTVFSDNFNRVSVGANWSTVNGSWAITSNALYATTGGGLDNTLATATTYTAAQWNNCRISVDFFMDNNTANALEVGVHFPTPNIQVNLFSPGWSPNNQDTNVTTNSTDPVTSRLYPMLLGYWNHMDVYVIQGVSNLSVAVILNGIEMMVNSFPNSALSTVVQLYANYTGTVKPGFDNFIFGVLNPQITVGTFDTTVQNVTNTFNSNTQLEALNWIADFMGWEYRTNPGAGAGSDTMDYGASVGTDLSSILTLQEGTNIVDMARDRTSQDLATSLYVYGQVMDDTSANFVSNDLTQMTTYGIIEKDYNNPMVVDVSTAKILGDNRISIMSAGNVSLSGTVIDESLLTEQSAGGLGVNWNAANWNAFEWAITVGARSRLRVGDTVTLVSPSLNINKTVRIVSLQRTSGTTALKLVFDYFPYRQTDAFRDLMQQYWDLRRGFINRMNAQNVELVFGAATTLNWYVYLRGQIQAVYLDVRINAGGPTYKIFIDSVDRTSALFGSATLTTDAHAKDTTYLISSGNHIIAVQVTLGTGTLDLALQTRVLS